MFENIKKKIKAINIIFKSNEYFVIGAFPDLKYTNNNQHNLIKYKYESNTNRKIFYNYCKHFIENLNKDKK